MKVTDLLNFVQSLAPVSMKVDWDNVGLLCGRRSKEVSRVLVALDPFEDVCEEAIAWGADCIVTHHPLIFRPAKAVTDETSVGRSILLLAENGIAAINAHTNLDCAPGGVNDVLAKQLGLSETAVIAPSGTTAEGQPWGLLRKGFVKSQPLSAFLPAVKTALQCEGLRYVDAGKPVHLVAVGGGACGSEMLDAVSAGCDTFITSDLRYNQFWDAHDLGLNLIDAGHFATENPVCGMLAAAISAQFPEISVKISEIHRDCMKFF